MVARSWSPIRQRRLLERSRPAELGLAAVTRCAEPGHGCFSCGRPDCGRTFRRCGRWTRDRATCGRAATSLVGRELEVTEIKAALQVTSTRHVDRRRRRRQDPACNRSRGATGRRIPRRCLGFRTGRSHRSGRGARCGRGGARYHSAAGQERRPSRWRLRLRAGSDAGVRQLRARPRRRGRLDRGDSCGSRRRVRILATSREGLGVADEQVWRVRSLGPRYGRGVVCRARSQCGTGLFGRR